MSTISALGSVEAYFILSGTFMAAAWETKYRHAMSPKLFYLNRVLRLWPTYLILLVVTCAAYIALGRPTSGHLLVFNLFNSLEQQGLTALNGFMVIIAVLIFGQDVVSVSETMHYMLPVRQSWSIASELLFYLAVPFVFGRLRPVLLCASFLVLMFVKIGLMAFPDWRSAYFPPIGNFGYFLLGGAIYAAASMPKLLALKQKYRWCRTIGTLLLVLFLCFFGEASLEFGGTFRHAVFVGVFATAIVFLFDGNQTKLDSVLGNLTYGIYLNHFLCIVVLTILGLKGLGLLYATIVCSVAVSVLIEMVVQRPIDRMRYAHAARIAAKQQT